ncbi:hypothetical protein ACIRU3_38505 [Streptomyces sp. NPDC101151]|uniref:hypothetical protein n=1 Tax=Streptomyces sp. NPDC101151 TaxID=3366115 RepID=UPI00380581F6
MPGDTRRSGARAALLPCAYFVEVNDVGVRADASGFHEPLVHGRGDVAAGGVHAAGEVGGVEAAGLGGSAGAFFGVVGALDDVAADAG